MKKSELDEWSDGPRPSFYGQLHGIKNKPRPAGDMLTKANAETVWADPLQQAEDEADLHQERDSYVRKQFVKSFASGYGDRQILAFAVTVAITAICWPYVERLPLVAWFATRTLLTAIHVSVTVRHRRLSVGDQPRSGYARWVVILATLNGAIFGSSVLLFLGNLPVSQQFACWLILAGAMTLPTHTLAFNPTRLRAYINSTFAAVMVCVLYRIFTSHAGLMTDMEDHHYEQWLLMLPLTLWLLILYIARRVHSSAQKNFEVDFYKHALIDALAAKRQRLKMPSTSRTALSLLQHMTCASP